jgi:foldase protein PrsA
LFIAPISNKLAHKPFTARRKEMKEKSNRMLLKLILAWLVLAVIGFGCSKTIATVNGEKITQAELNERLMQQAGQQVLNQIITEKLILQEARKKNIQIEAKDINQQIEEIKKQFPDEATFQQNLAENNMTLDYLKSQIELELIVKKLLQKEIEVTDKEVEDYYKQNKDTVYSGKKFEEVKDEIKEQLEFQNLSIKSQELLEELRKKAKIENALETK